MDERDGRIAFVGELPDDDDYSLLSGRFAVHWESREGREHGDGLEGVSVGEAIEWGRAHAAFVSVLFGDSDVSYSAGERDLTELDGDEADPSPRWPEEGMTVRARPPGTPRDGSVQQIDWGIEAGMSCLPDNGGDELATLRAALGADARLRDVELEASDRSGSAVMRCRFLARGATSAVLEVHRALERALAAAFPQHPAVVETTGSLGPACDR